MAVAEEEVGTILQAPEQLEEVVATTIKCRVLTPLKVLLVVSTPIPMHMAIRPVVVVVRAALA